MLSKIAAYMETWNMIEKGDRIIAGVSGGADSVCLLFVLLELQKKYPFELTAVHVNHGLRGEAADADEAYVTALCRQQNVPCIVYREDVKQLAKERKQSTEEAGRMLRRELFEKTLQMQGGGKVALAHHKNDNAETLILNLARGSGLKGLGGMRPVAGHFIRPLLCVERSEIESYLEERGIAYCTDETNHEDDYARNRIRHHMIPYMEQEINRKTVSHMERTMEQLREVQDYLESETEKYLPACVEWTAEGYTVWEKAFASLPKVIRPLVLKRLLTELSGKAKDIESVHMEMLQELFEKQVGRRVDLPYGLVAKRVYDGITIGRQTDENSKMKEEIPLKPEEGHFQLVSFGNYRISCRILKIEEWEEKVTQKSNTKAFDYDIISDIITVRTRRAGDYITLHPDGGTQKLKSYFINEKIKEELRDSILLVAEGSHLLWIVGYRTNPAYAVGRNTKRVLEIQIEKGE